MDYERIDMTQVGVLSPSKLRMKLLGPHNSRKKEGRNGSPRTSPTKIAEIDHAKSSLLLDDCKEYADNGDCKGEDEMNLSLKEISDHSNGNSCDSYQDAMNFKEEDGTLVSRIITNSPPCHVKHDLNMSSMCISKSQDDVISHESRNDSLNNSNFEFQRARTMHHAVRSPFSRHIPSKWNDAEKWIVSRQVMNTLKKLAGQNPVNHLTMSNSLHAVSQSTIAADQNKYVNHASRAENFNNLGNLSRIVVEKFSFTPHSLSSSGSTTKTSGVSDQSSVPDDCSSTPRLLQHQERKEIFSDQTLATQVLSSIHSVSMRDVGTEMTPIASQDPSRAATPVGATTPAHSPISSIPSTPKKMAPTLSPTKENGSAKGGCRNTLKEVDLSERDQLRKEIVALGLQLGKMNIASWASKEVENSSAALKINSKVQLKKAEYEARAAAWEEAEKSKHIARFKREEGKIQEWENYQKAKIEAKIRKIETQADQMKAYAEEKRVERLAVTQQLVEKRQTNARDRMDRCVARTARQVEQIRQTGRPPSTQIWLCIWFS